MRQDLFCASTKSLAYLFVFLQTLPYQGAKLPSNLGRPK